jgi:archaellum component FlaC
VVSSIQPFLEFFIGIFGALAIIGVFFKIQGYPNSELFMILGFMGEAAAFVIMGSFALLTHFLGEDRTPGAASQEVVPVAQQPSEAQEVSASFRTMMEEQISDDLSAMMGALGQEVQHFGKQIHEMTGEMERTRAALGQMQDALGSVADGRLAEQADALGEGMEEINMQLQRSSQAIGGAHSALEQMEAGLSRAAGGSLPEDAERLEEGMKVLGEEVHVMSGEMGPARTAVERMRGELEQVTSGNLAEDAQRLGEGMNHLGGEMEGARYAVETLRSDLDEMAARFQQFNRVPEASGEGKPPSNGEAHSTARSQASAS